MTSTYSLFHALTATFAVPTSSPSPSIQATTINNSTTSSSSSNCSSNTSSSSVTPPPLTLTDPHPLPCLSHHSHRHQSIDLSACDEECTGVDMGMDVVSGVARERDGEPNARRHKSDDTFMFGAGSNSSSSSASTTSNEEEEETEIRLTLPRERTQTTEHTRTTTDTHSSTFHPSLHSTHLPVDPFDPRKQQKRRRLGFSVFVDPLNDHPDNHLLRHLTLTAANVAPKEKNLRLQHLLHSHPLFRTLSPEIIRRVYTEFIREVRGPDSIVFRAGDVSDVFYLLDQGEVCCVYEDALGGRTILNKRAGDTIGDLSLMQPSIEPQQFTCKTPSSTGNGSNSNGSRTDEGAALYSIDGCIFRFIVQNGMQLRYQQLKTFFEGLDMFASSSLSSHSHELIENLIENAQILEFNRGDLILPLSSPAAATTLTAPLTPLHTPHTLFSSPTSLTHSRPSSRTSASRTQLIHPSSSLPLFSLHTSTSVDSLVMPTLTRQGSADRIQTTSNHTILLSPNQHMSLSPASHSLSPSSVAPFSFNIIAPSPPAAAGVPAHAAPASAFSFNCTSPSLSASPSCSSVPSLFPPALPAYLSNSVFIVKDGRVRIQRAATSSPASTTADNEQMTPPHTQQSPININSNMEQVCAAADAAATTSVNTDEISIVSDGGVFGLEILSCPHRLLERTDVAGRHSPSSVSTPTHTACSLSSSSSSSAADSSPRLHHHSHSQPKSHRKRGRSDTLILNMPATPHPSPNFIPHTSTTSSSSHIDSPLQHLRTVSQQALIRAAMQQPPSPSMQPNMGGFNATNMPIMLSPSPSPSPSPFFPSHLSSSSSFPPALPPSPFLGPSASSSSGSGGELHAVSACTCRGEIKCESNAAIVIAIDARVWKQVILKTI